MEEIALNQSFFKLYFQNTKEENAGNYEINTTGDVCILNVLKTIASIGSF